MVMSTTTREVGGSSLARRKTLFIILLFSAGLIIIAIDRSQTKSVILQLAVKSLREVNETHSSIRTLSTNEPKKSVTNDPTTSPTKEPTKSPSLLPTQTPVKAIHDRTICHGITPPPTTNSSLAAKYVVFFPRAGMGNVLMSYISSVMYACLTGRQIKIAPREIRETEIFDCPEYFDSGPGSICDDLEMSDDMQRRYYASHALVRSPEAWDITHCSKRRQDLIYFMCDDGLGEEEFVVVNSCQFWGDLLYNNPYFKERLPSNFFRQVLRASLRPSANVQAKMVLDGGHGRYHVCIHARWGVVDTAKTLGQDWINNLGSCVRNLFQDNQLEEGKEKRVLLFTMHEDVRQAVRSSLQSDGEYTVTYASESLPTGPLGMTDDNHQGIADMFSMGQLCHNLFPTKKESTYLLVGANMMESIKVFPGEQWKDGCMEGSELTELNPEGDYWNQKDYCDVRDTTCAAHINSVHVESDDQSQIDNHKDPKEAATNESTHDDKCERMFEWSMMDRWQSDGKEFNLDNLPQSKSLSISRMGGPSADGILKMQIKAMNRKLELTVVDLTTRIKDLKSPNVFHRYTALYGTWVGVQISQRRYNLTTNRTVFVHDCNGDLPLEWLNLGEQSCDGSLIQQADVVIVPPVDGLMWDLAWDFDFECQHSEMFEAFASLFVNKTLGIEPTEPMGCWISRRGSSVRNAANLDDILNMMKEIFPRVEELIFTPDLLTNETVNMMTECRVLMGIHGAGHVNAIYARPGVGVVEIIGKDRPAYFRNINMLLGQHYESIIGDKNRGIQDDNFIVDLDEARSALIRAREHAAAWIESHGYWR